MPAYTWFGIDSAGKKIKGVNYANNNGQLRNKLSKQNIFPVKIKIIIFKINTKHITAFIEQLAILINANTPLITALNILIADTKNENLKNLIIDCKNSISTGQSLYKTLCQYPQYFNNLLCNLINVGEQSGTLSIVLNELADYFTKIAAQKRKIMKALLYPIVILNIAFAVTAILLLFVIPEFKTMYESLGAHLPGYTQFIINLGDFFSSYYIFILMGIASIIIFIKLAYKYSIKFRRFTDITNLKIPIIGKILTYDITARLTKTIYLSFKSGMPLIKAIKISTGTTQNWRYQLAMQNITKSITNGKTLHSSMEEQNLFSQKIIQLVALGEETGTLDAMLEKISIIYSDELNNITDNLNNLLEPIIMLILGVLVGGLIIGMYLPIFRLGMAI